ncbi:MAG: hypothetical protein ACJ75J_00175 [Cytophagaceae bacterium]
MKKLIAIASFIYISSTLISGCSNSAENVQKAQDNVKNANQDLDIANKEYLADVEAYRKEAAAKIAANEKSIAEFKARKQADKNAAKADYDLEVAALERKNSDMKKQLDDYQFQGAEKWDLFKSEFSHGMDELGKAFKDLI